MNCYVDTPHPSMGSERTRAGACCCGDRDLLSNSGGFRFGGQATGLLEDLGVPSGRSRARGGARRGRAVREQINGEYEERRRARPPTPTAVPPRLTTPGHGIGGLPNHHIGAVLEPGSRMVLPYWATRTEAGQPYPD